MSWALLTRAGSEKDLQDELGRDHPARRLVDGIVSTKTRPRAHDGSLLELAFARQAMRIAGEPVPLNASEIARALDQTFRAQRPTKGPPWRWNLQVVAPDSKNPRDPRRPAAEGLAEVLPEVLGELLPKSVAEAERSDPAEADRLVQVWILDETRALVGVTTVSQALSIHPGGRRRLRRGTESPSRAGLKLEEAIDWIGLGPERGDQCVDFGAAPGGWSEVALRRGASVTGVDPARIKLDNVPKKFRHVQGSAFDYVPDETADWLLCDMAWRPLEVAKLLAKWGRRVWARQLFANIKLPMKKKAEMLAQVRKILEEAGWRGLRARQLFHDRDEITLFAWLDPQRARLGPQAPFELRSRRKSKPRDRGAQDRAKRPAGRRGEPRGRARPKKPRGRPKR